MFIKNIYFNTLVQTETSIFDDLHELDDCELIYGLGSDLTDRDTLHNRAKRVLVTRRLMVALIGAAEAKGAHERLAPYWNTFYCMKEVLISGERVHAKYCKNCFCMVCSAIRKADIINRYYPTIVTWSDPHFVTLTLKAVPAERLAQRLKDMQNTFQRIKNEFKTKARRGKDIKLVGVKSLESNFNPIKRTYNPHYHLIVQDARMAVILRREWHRRWGSTEVNTAHQKATRVRNLHSCLKEIIKYIGKVFTDPDMAKGKKVNVPPMIYASALDHIFPCMKGIRIFDRFGFNRSVLVKAPKVESKIIINPERYEYNLKVANWVSPMSGELLTSYQPSHEILDLFSNRVDVGLM